jgi:hypothetical protein
MTKDPRKGTPSYAEAPAHEFLRTHAIGGRRSSRKVRELFDSMEYVGWDGAPIAVVEHQGEKYILDGHHRCYAARRANISVRYRLIRLEDLKVFGYDSIDQVLIAHAEVGSNKIRKH